MSEQIAQALKALIQGANPFARVEVDWDKPPAIDAGGFFNIIKGDPGDAIIDLSPLTYNYEHVFKVEVFGFPSAALTAGQVIEQLLMPVGRAVEMDRGLGGLVTFLGVTAAVETTATETGTDIIPAAEFEFVASYATRHPLG